MFVVQTAGGGDIPVIIYYNRKYIDLDVPGLEHRIFRLPGEYSTIELHKILFTGLCSLHILCVSAIPYINPPDEAQSAKETDTLHTEVVRS